MNHRTAALLAALSIAAGATVVPGATAAAGAVLESRPVGSFDRIRLEGPADLEFTPGDRHAVVIEAEPRIQTRISLRIEQGELRFDLGEGPLQTRSRLRFHVSAPRLDGLTTAGSGDALLHGTQGRHFTLAAGGSGDVVIEHLDARQLEIVHTGAGDVRMSGRCHTLAARSADSGNLALEALDCIQGRIRLQGSGDATAHVSRLLEAELAGSGDLTVIGRPTIRDRRTGVGELRLVSSP